MRMFLYKKLEPSLILQELLSRVKMYPQTLQSPGENEACFLLPERCILNWGKIQSECIQWMSLRIVKEWEVYNTLKWVSICFKIFIDLNFFIASGRSQAIHEIAESKAMFKYWDKSDLPHKRQTHKSWRYQWISDLLWIPWDAQRKGSSGSWNFHYEERSFSNTLTSTYPWLLLFWAHRFTVTTRMRWELWVISPAT